MKTFKLVFTLCIVFTSINAVAQLCTDDDRFTNAEYFNSTQIDSLKNVTYGKAVDYLGVEQELKMDFYFPKNDQDAMQKRPFILLIHGGGFVGGNRESFTYHCNEFAKRGFVVATMSYRLGYNQEVMMDNAKAVYRAQQDANSALKYVATQAESLKIDTSWVFLGGTSAGAITSHFTAYASQQEWVQVFPEIETEIGAIEAIDAVSIQGIYNNMGSVAPMVLPNQVFVPTVSFHGELDKTVPIDKSMITGFGSREIHKLLNESGVCNDLTIVPDGGHGIYRTPEGLDFRINRVACFFKSLICGTCVNFLARETVPAACAE